MTSTTRRVGANRVRSPARRPPSGSDCPEPLRIVAYADGIEEPDREAHRLESHLTVCRACAVAVERLRRAVAGSRPPGWNPRGMATQAVEGGAALLARLKSLVSFAMPLRVTFAVRASVPIRAAGYRRGMEHYEGGRYAAAAKHLESARAAGVAPPDLTFYLGVCRLHEGDAEEAARLLRDAGRRRPRVGEIRWYEAQAHLSCGRARAATLALRQAARLPGPHRERARLLLESLRASLASLD